MRFAQDASYRTNFILRCLTLASFDLILPFITVLIYLNSDGFFGWKFEEILIFQGFYLMITALDRFFFQRIDWKLSEDVRTGNFDRYLLVPMHTITYMVFSSLGVEQIVNFMIGFCIIIGTILWYGLSVTFTGFFLVILYMLLALIFTTALSIIKYGIIVVTVTTGRTSEFFRTIKSYGQYPVSIYGEVLGTIFRYFIPLVLLSNEQTRSLIKNIDLVNTFPSLILITLSVALLYLISVFLWNEIIRRYQSAGG